MSLEKNVKRDIKRILQIVFPWLEDEKIRKSDSLFYDLDIYTNQHFKALKSAIWEVFEVKVKKSALDDCDDVEELIDLVLEKLHKKFRNLEKEREEKPSGKLMLQMTAKLARVDGPINPFETRWLNAFLDRLEKLPLARKEELVKMWVKTSKDSYDFEWYLSEYFRLHGQETELYSTTLYTLFELAIADEEIGPKEERLLQLTAAQFGMAEDYPSLRQYLIEQLHKPYKTLGCQRSDSTETIKKAYRKLSMELHPDKFAAMNLPERMLQISKEQLQEIIEAYESIKAERGFA